MKSKSWTIYIRHFYGIFMFIVGKIFIQLISVCLPRFFVADGQVQLKKEFQLIASALIPPNDWE